VHRTLVSPDGRTVVKTLEENTGGRLGMRPRGHLVRQWDVATGKELPPLNGGDPLNGAFSPDGRLVVTQGVSAVCDVATGERVANLPDDLHIRAAAFSRDGRFLATTGTGDVIQLWEVASWTKRSEFKGHRDQPTTLAFMPGGQFLSGSLDTTVLAWDTRPPRVANSVSLESAWNNLATKESGESFKSQGRFLAASAETVKFFAEKIKPVEALDPKRIQRWLADLGSDVFAVREGASTALLGLDEQAIPFLDATLKNAESAEVRERVKKILEQKRRAAMTTEQLRQIRAVMLLEMIADAESKNLLKKWASGPVGALLTMEAAGAVKRLEGAANAKR
jgi:WD domain, G-beta repeat